MKLARPKITAKICATAALVAVLAAAGTATVAGAALRADAPFNDVGEDHLFGDQISVLVDAGVLDQSDATDGKFNSGEPVHPEDMIKWMYNLSDKHDVDRSYLDHLEAEATTRRPTLTRNNAANLFSNFFDLPRPGNTHTFSDVSSWYAKSVSAMQAAGITVGCGTGEAYCGTRTLTRGQAAAFMGRFVEKYGNSRAGNTSTGYSYDDAQSYYSARQYVRSGTATSTPSFECSGDHHPHFSGGGGAPPGGCHEHAVSVPACSATAGNNQSYIIHVGDGHSSGNVPACPAPQISLNSPDLRLVVTAGQTPVIVLQAAEGALTTRSYDVTLAPYEQSESERAGCSDTPPTPRVRQPRANPPTPSPPCTTPARPVDDYADVTWSSVEIGPGLPPVALRIIDPDTGMAVPPRLDFGDQPRAFEIIIADTKNPDVSVSEVATINPPAIGAS